MSSPYQLSFSGKNVLVTGAGSGIGRAICLGFASAGARVIAADRNGRSLSQVVSEIISAGAIALAQEWDVADPAAALSVSRMLRDDGILISALVNNAGIAGRSEIGSEGYLDHWKRIQSVNVDGIAFTTHAFRDHLQETGGTIVNIASIQSFVSLPFRSSAYTTSKGAVAQFTKACAAGPIETPLTQAAREDPEYLRYFRERTPLPRMGKPDDVVGPVLFLSSNYASYITGAVLPIDGGFLAL
jgi:NAD(P)-dependent dehydrogenase (short-subunit alcohol dehydrogenase family)